MGLDASVRCSCWQDGLTSEPPVPREMLHFDERCGLVLEVKNWSEQKEEMLWDWAQTACEHPGLVYSCERIGGYEDCNRFVEVLRQTDHCRFRTLIAEVEGRGEGLTSPAAAEQALAELSYFRSLALARESYLVNSATGERLSGLGCGLWPSADALLEACIEGGQFVVREAVSGADLFRCRRFRVRPVPGQGPDIDLFDAGTGRRVQLPFFALVLFDELPDEVHVTEREVCPEEFKHIISRLEVVFRASVQAGRPVCWS